MDQPGKVANPARGQLNRENEHSPVPRTVDAYTDLFTPHACCLLRACAGHFMGAVGCVMGWNFTGLAGSNDVTAFSRGTP